jgi:hypothetical protein
MNRRKIIFLQMVFALCLMIALSGTAISGPIVFDQWYEFAFSLGYASTGCFPEDPSGPGCTPSSGGDSVFADEPAWQFSVPSGSTVELTVTDAFLYGDAFKVYDTAHTFIGETPAVAIGGDSGLSDPELALLDPGLSHASFLLPGGDYGHYYFILINPYQQSAPGAAYFKVEVVPEGVPEPSTLLLLGGGLISLVAVRRKLRK